MTRRLLVLAFVVAGGAALTATASSLAPGGSPLLRPFHLPHLASGAPCPVSRVDRRIPFVRRFGVGPGIGKGPAYPIIGRPAGMSDRVLELAPAENFDSGNWAGQKVLWFVLPSYRGPVLIRGARIDGPGRVRFDRGDVPALRIRIRRDAQAEFGSVVMEKGRQRASYTRVRGPGCYAYQVDGTSFSHVVVFRAIWSTGQ